MNACVLVLSALVAVAYTAVTDPALESVAQYKTVTDADLERVAQKWIDNETWAGGHHPVMTKFEYEKTPVITFVYFD